MTVAPDAAEMLRRLGASGPADEHAEALMTFGRFVGAWDVEMTGHRDDEASPPYVGRWTFGWILEGRGVQDVLTVRPVERRDGWPAGGIGTTVRVYDPTLDAWWVVWLGPEDREFNTHLARATDDEIVLERQWSLAPDDAGSRWIFSDIREDSFAWRAEVRGADGLWRVVARMVARRRSA